MKAAVIYENGPPDVLRYEDVPDPECPDGCVLIDVEAISIEGGDLLARAESPPPSVPHIVGYLAAGTVTEVGAGVEDRAVGDRVVTLIAAGSHASNGWFPRSSPGRSPTGWTLLAPRVCRWRSAPPRSACSPPATSKQGQTVLIHAGGGGVGMAAIQLAKQAGRDGDLDRVERREARAAEGVRARPRDQLRHRELRRARRAS